MTILFKCSECGSEYGLGQYSCDNKDGILEIKREYSELKSIKDLILDDNKGIWKYEPILPKADDQISSYEGNTPLIESDYLGKKLGVNLAYKDEGRNPTGSFKDRAAAVMLSMEKKMGHNDCTTASSGNAAGALALYSALANIHSYIFMFKPSVEKLYHTISHGPTVFNVETNSEQEVHDLTEKATKEFGWYHLTTTAAANPFVVEGYKTIAFEIFEDTGVPDYIFTPVGSGTLLLGIYKGFSELRKLGLTDAIPRIVGVQAQGCNPIVRAFQKNEEKVTPVLEANTRATALSLEDPGINGNEVLKATNSCKGKLIDVSDKEVSNILTKLPSKEGIFSEFSGTLGVAGVIKAREEGILKEGDDIVAIISGSGFKDISNLKKEMNKANDITPQISAVENVLK